MLKASVPIEIRGTATFSRRFRTLPLVIGILLVLGIWSLVIPCSASEPVKIIKVESKTIGQFDEVHVFTSQNIKPEIILLESPNRVAMAFSNARIDAPLTLPGPSPLIRMIQAAQFDENTVYVIVEPNEKLTYEFASIIGRNKFILEFTKARPGAAKVVAPSAPQTAEVFQIVTAEEIVEAEKPVAAAVTSNISLHTSEISLPPPVIEAITEEAVPVIKAAKPVKIIKQAEISKIPLPLKGKTIVIDPGHGGRDPGFVGKSGIFEKFLNLKIALKLRKFLTDAGAKVIMTRTKDLNIPNSGIVKVANDSNADIFVAIHLNSYASPRAGGSQTYYFTPQSKTFAKTMQKCLCQTIKLRNRGVRKVTYYTVHHTKMPAVLVESAYLTNPREEKLVLDPKFQSNVALGLYKGIKEYVRISSWQRSR